MSILIEFFWFADSFVELLCGSISPLVVQGECAVRVHYNSLNVAAAHVTLFHPSLLMSAFVETALWQAALVDFLCMLKKNLFPTYAQAAMSECQSQSLEFLRFWYQ